MKKIRKISVIGAGAIGATFGGLIKHRKPEMEMVFIARGQHCQAMQQRKGVVLKGDWGEVEVPVTATSDPQAVEGSDFVLFTVKTQDTESTARQFAPMIGDAAVVSLQNGINQHVLSKILRRDRLMVGMTATNMAIVEPGVVVCQRRGVSVIGPADASVSDATVQQACQTLALSGLPVEATASIVGAQYNKLLFNTMGYASVLSATDFLRDGILDHQWRNQVALPIRAEGLRVLEAAKIPLQRVSGMSDYVRFGRLMGALNTPALGTFVKWMMKGPAKPPQLVFSVYQDLLRHRPTEIDFVNGEIVRLAEAHGVRAPLNAEVVRRVHAMEREEQPVFLDRAEIADAFHTLRRERSDGNECDANS
ncbi:MAG: 2-dehydropantoate 2-reductase [Pirellulaceae bacterium]